MAELAPQPTTRSWKLSPSALTFLWDGCKRCFYLSVVHGMSQPSMPLPGMFTKIAARQKTFFDGRSTLELVPELRPGVFAYGEKKVRSQEIATPGRTSTCYVSGRFDTVVRFDDETYGVIDFKTSEPSETSAQHYGRQLHAYAYALEHPAPGALALAPISVLGLLCLDPARMVQGRSGRTYYLECKPVWIPYPRDDRAFLELLGQVVDVLDSPEPPPHSPSCRWCAYRNDARRTGH